MSELPFGTRTNGGMTHRILDGMSHWRERVVEIYPPGAPAQLDSPTMMGRRVEQAISSPVHEQWGMISEKEVLLINGRRDLLEDLLEQKYGMSKDEASQEVSFWTTGNHQVL